MVLRRCTVRIIVLGGGYAGLTAANRLRRPGLVVTVVNPRPEFVERIRLHQFVAGTHRGTASYDGLLGRGIGLVVDSARLIDPVRRRVVLASGELLEYDFLVYAVGSSSRRPALVLGGRSSAYCVGDAASAVALRRAILRADPAAPITVVGGGLTGVETAAELADRGRNVVLVVRGRLCPSLSSSARASVTSALDDMGVEIVENAAVEGDEPTSTAPEDGGSGRTGLTIWATGFTASPLAAASGLRCDEHGRLLTDSTLASLDAPDIVAAGDSVAPAGWSLRMSCQAAGPLGAQAADTVLSRIDDLPAPSINQGFVGQCLSLGRTRAVWQLSRRDDTPLDRHMRGRAAALVKEVICRASMIALRAEAHRPGSSVWVRSGRSTVRWPDGAPEAGWPR